MTKKDKVIKIDQTISYVLNVFMKDGSVRTFHDIKKHEEKDNRLFMFEKGAKKPHRIILDVVEKYLIKE